MHGKGTMVWKDGSKYQGDFRRSQMEGMGHKQFSNGDQYTGEWLNDQMNGQGTITKPNGDKITGLWVNGEFAPEEIQDNGTPWRHMRNVQYDAPRGSNV